MPLVSALILQSFFFFSTNHIVLRLLFCLLLSLICKKLEKVGWGSSVHPIAACRYCMYSVIGTQLNSFELMDYWLPILQIPKNIIPHQTYRQQNQFTRIHYLTRISYNMRCKGVVSFFSFAFGLCLLAAVWGPSKVSARRGWGMKVVLA